MPDKCFHAGYEYSCNRKHKDTVYYKCSKVAGSKCTARLIAKCGNYILRGQHYCNGSTSISMASDVSANSLIELLSRDLTLTPSQIHQHVVFHFCSQEAEEGIAMIPSLANVRVKVRALREGSSVSVGTIIESRYQVIVDGRRFLRRIWKGDIEGKGHAIVIWASEEGLSVLRQQGEELIDGTFRVVPPGYAQVVIVMTLDQATNVKTPRVWAVLTGKTEALYWVLFQEIIGLLDWKWSPRLIILDFELALIKAARGQFMASG